MKKLFAITLLIIVSIATEGSGFVGDKPDIESYFNKDRELKNQPQEEAQDSNPIKNVSQEIEIEPPPGILKINNHLEKLAPSNMTKDNIELFDKPKKAGYTGDILEFKQRLEKLKNTILTSSNIQHYAAKANVFNFYTHNFLDKYKDKPDSNQLSYKAINDVNILTQQILNDWLEARANSKYVPYSAFNGAYQPTAIRIKLKKLNSKLDEVISIINEVDL